jgi:hypothetical protein
VADALLGLGDGEEDDQQGHAHPVVQAALDVQALADARGQPRVGDHRQPQRGVGGRQHGGQGGRGPQVEPREQGQGGDGAGHDGEGQADPEQPRRQGGLAPQPAQVDPDRVGEQHQRQGRLGQPADELAGHIHLDRVQEPVADQQAEGDEGHRLADRGGPQAPRHRGVGQQRQGDRGQGPLVHASSPVGPPDPPEWGMTRHPPPGMIRRMSAGR